MVTLESPEQKPLVSVIVNCFNGEKYLRECLHSILNQTYRNWELIFWDNQSTDKSKEIFQEFTDNRFKYHLSDKHTFLYEARDLAIKSSNGNFFTFCDVDDYWSKERLESLIPLFKNQNIGIVYSNQWIINERNNKKKKYTNKLLPSGNLRSSIIRNPSVTILNTLIKKTEYIKMENGFNKNYKIIGDFDFFVRISRTCQFNSIQTPLVYYRLHENNFTKRHRELEVEELDSWFKKNRKIVNFFTEEEIDLITQRILYKKTTILILNKEILRSLANILKIKSKLKKIKLIFALLLPKKILEKIKEY